MPTPINAAQHDKNGADEEEKAAHGQWKLALADFDKAIELDPHLSVAFDRRGLLHRSLGDLGAALDDFNREINLQPDSASAYNNRALTLEDQGHFSEALAEFDRAIKLNRKDASIYANRGLLRLNSEVESEQEILARQDFEACLQLNPALKPTLDRLIAQFRANRAKAKARHDSATEGKSAENK